MHLDHTSKPLIQNLYLLADSDVDEITQMLDDIYWKVLILLRQRKLNTQPNGASEDIMKDNDIFS